MHKHCWLSHRYQKKILFWLVHEFPSHHKPRHFSSTTFFEEVSQLQVQSGSLPKPVVVGGTRAAVDRKFDSLSSESFLKNCFWCKISDINSPVALGVLQTCPSLGGPCHSRTRKMERAFIATRAFYPDGEVLKDPSTGQRTCFFVASPQRPCWMKIRWSNGNQTWLQLNMPQIWFPK